MRRSRTARAVPGWGAAVAAAFVLAGAGLAHAAAVVPGATEPSVPVETLPSEPTLPSADAWGALTLAPIRWWGNLGLDLRYRGGDALATADSEALSAIGYFSSYVWQPWFARVQGSLGGIVTRDGGGGENGNATSVNALGDIELGLFPMSRFPFTLYAGVTDTRANGAASDIDYRDHRVRLSQQYQHAQRNERYSLTYEQSMLRSDQVSDPAFASPEAALDPPTTTSTDRLRVLRGGWSRSWNGQSMELDASLVRNRSQQGRLMRESAFDVATLRHVYDPSPALNVSTTASLTRNENDFSESGSEARLRFGSTFLQVSSFASYRPQAGDPLYVEDHPLNVTGTARLFRTTQDSGSVLDDTASGASASLGVTYDLRRDLQLFSIAQAFTFSGLADRSGFSQSVGVNYFPEPIPIGDYRYGWNASTSAFGGASNDEAARRFGGVQGSVGHVLSRTWEVAEQGALMATVSQNVAARYDSREDAEQSLNHSLSLFWTDSGAAARQGFVGLTLSDSRRFGRGKGSFQLANLQATIRHHLSRRSFWSGSLTLQATRSDEEPIVFVDDAPPLPDPDRGRWRYAAGGSLVYTHTAAFGVPRLQFQSILQADTYSLRRRELGDFDAPTEQVNWSFENRLDYAIGRLYASLVGRIAELESRGRQWQVYLRIQRSFGSL